MKQPKVELAKVRDFSAIINDSFLFLKQNFKPLLRSFFTFCGFFLVASVVTSILQQLKMHELLTENGLDSMSSNKVYGYIKTWGWEAAFSVLFMLLTYTALPVTVLCYIAIYKEKGNIPPTNEEMWGYIKYYFLKSLGSIILCFIVIMIGFVFCIIPGFWLYPIMSLVLPIIIMENATIGYAFNQSFRLIKDNWWMTFGALFIMGFIVGICGAIVTVPAALWSQFSILLHWPGGKIATILSGVLSHVALVLYILPVITLALCYFSLNEQKEGTGLMARINQIGDNKSDSNLPAEEY